MPQNFVNFVTRKPATFFASVWWNTDNRENK